MSLTADRRSLLLLALTFSLLLHAVAVALAPMSSAGRLGEVSLPIELVPFTAPAPVAPRVEPERPSPSVRPPRALKRSAPPQPAAPPTPTVSDEGGEVPAPAEPLPLVFPARFTERVEGHLRETAQPSSGEGSAVATTAPELLQEIKPAYPDEARRADVDGDVLLRVGIAADGTVESVQVESSPGHGLDAAARAAMLKARFKPATRGGLAVPTTILYRYVFRLD